MDYEQFKEQVLALTKINLHMYKEKQMKRRIDSLISKHKIDGYKSYVEAIKRMRSFLMNLSIILL